MFYQNCKRKLKEVWFVFRWFLIGKYHCKLEGRQRLVYSIGHKVLWLILTLGLALVAGEIMEVLFNVS
ncbi:hypothetical protein [Helicobacter sp. WB40]|uniref:hypothetical protein n=1 Tax=Helicobacter sp. WB40 TaxID=3004130 RepID=UPI0022EBD916|nr:hypothetical protein [Helicobacter sp. WB40]MDA3967369.1 hypothetical protein [Helicobacter sp. WB40]